MDYVESIRVFKLQPQMNYIFLGARFIELRTSMIKISELVYLYESNTQHFSDPHTILYFREGL